MKGYISNSKKDHQWYSRYTRIAFGYTVEIMDWKYGHVTRITNYYFLFWHLRFTQAFLKLP